MTRLGGVTAALTLALLGGCATLSEEECLAGDWRSIGYQDGTRGRTTEQLARHAKACAEVGVMPEREAWLDGRAQGLKLYCTPGNVYEEGRRGRSLSPVCPEARQVALRRANRDGLRYRELSDEISEAERRQRAIRGALAGLAADDPKRDALRAEYRSLDSRLSFLRLRRLVLDRP